MVETASRPPVAAGKYAWISGGLGGFGIAFTKALLTAGAAGVYLVDLHTASAGRAKLRSVVAVADRARAVHYEPCDVTNHAAVRQSLERAAVLFNGQLDVVINNAGVAQGDCADARRVIDVNLTAVVVATDAALELLCRLRRNRDAPPACVVNVASAAGVMPTPSAPVYAASKHGVVGYGRSMVGLLAQKHIRVNTLCPGFTDTPFLSKEARDDPLVRSLGMMQPETVANALLGIVGNPDMEAEVVFVSQRVGVAYPMEGILEHLRLAARSNQDRRHRM